MYISWRSRRVKGLGGHRFLFEDGEYPVDWSYFHAWHTVKCEHTGPNRVAWTAFLIKSERVDGKPRQKILHRFPTIRSCCIADSWTRAAWWYLIEYTHKSFAEDGDGFDREGHYRDWPACVAKLREVVPEPTRRAKSEFAKFAADEFERPAMERQEEIRRQHREWFEAQERRQAEERARAESDERAASGTDVADDFAALGLATSATAAELKARFRELAKVHHPDKGGDPAEFRRFREAYDRIIKSRASRPA